MSVQETIAATEAAISRVDSNAPPAWKAAADAAIEYCAGRYVTFTADEVWEQLQVKGIAPPHTPSALGPAFRRASIKGLIMNTHTWRKHSKFSQRHRELLIWAGVS